MGWGALFFSFSGRINRAKYWLASILLLLAFLLLIFVALVPFAISADELTIVVLVPLLVIGAGVMISGLAIASKRLHDRNKSAWWLLLFYVAPGFLGAIGDVGLILHFISFAISIWALIELGFLRGTAGANRFGPDPLANVGSQPVAPARSVT